jgi:hypothetical protein
VNVCETVCETVYETVCETVCCTRDFDGLTAAEEREDLDDGQTAGITSAGRNPETVANVRELVTTDRRVTPKLMWGANCTSPGRGFVKI